VNIDVGQIGLTRREFLRRAGAVGVGLSLSANVLAACGANSTSSRSVLSVGATDWLPSDFFLENSLGAQLIGYSQMAWALFMSEGNGFSYRNALASGYEVSPDGLTHAVKLRDGMTFHDGSPIDADAVAANLRGTFFKDDPLHRGSATYIQVVITLGDPPIVHSVDVVDKRTVAIKLSEYRSDIKTALAFILILNPKILRLKNYGTNVKALARGGSGPYRLTRWSSGDFAEFQRYEKFFQPVKVERVRLQRISDPGALALALRRGDIGVASGLAKADFDSLAKSNFSPVVSAPAVNVDLVFSHPKDPAFADPRVRRAVGLAMNREAYTERFFSTGTAKWSSQPIIPPGVPGYVDTLRPRRYDRAAAKALMATAGVSRAKLILDGPNAQAPISSTKDMLEAIAQDLSQIGIDATIRILDGAAEGTLIQAGKAEAFIFGPGGQPDPFILFDLFFGKGSPYAPGQLPKYPAITAALAKAHATRDLAERDRLLRSIIQTTTDQALLIPVSVVSYSALVKSSIHDFHLSATQLDSWNGVAVAS